MPAPARALSEGRVEDDGTLLCAYHAWRFDETGKCVDMPQASSKEEEERVKANPRSCAFTRPTAEAQGLVWAWGEGGEEAEMEARMTPALLVPEIEGVGKSGEAPGGAFRNHWQVRDMPYGWAAFSKMPSIQRTQWCRITRSWGPDTTIPPDLSAWWSDP